MKNEYEIGGISVVMTSALDREHAATMYANSLGRAQLAAILRCNEIAVGEETIEELREIVAAGLSCETIEAVDFEFDQLSGRPGDSPFGGK